jgi:hypothetical protein
MKTFHLTFVLCILTFLSFGQRIQSVEDVELIKSKIDHQSNLKDFVITPNLFTNTGKTSPGKFSYKFLYDTSFYSLVKIEINNIDRKEIQSFYFTNDQLILVNLKKKNEYFFDADFEIPYWGEVTDNLTEKRDKLKETAYRLLIRFKKDLLKRI